MESNKCLSCRFGSVKIEISVPERYNIKEFAKQTRKYTANILTITKQKPIHYSLIFDSARQNAALGLDFKVDCSCILNVKRHDCSKFNSIAERNCRVRHLDQGKEMGIEVIQTV